MPADGTEPRHNSYMIRFKTEIETGLFVDVEDETVRAELERQRTDLCYGCSRCQLDSTAKLVHVPCLQLARARLGRVSLRLLHDLGWLLRPVVPWADAKHLWDHRGRLLRLPCDAVSSSTQAGLAVRDVLEKLPPELQETVCGMIPPGIFLSLAACLDTLAWVESHQGLLGGKVPMQQSLSSVVPFEHGVSLGTLSADTIDILGEIFLVRIAGGPEAIHGCQITLSDKPIEGVQYALGLYGVVALRVHYQDGSASAWLGHPPPKWMKFVRGTNLQGLTVHSDVSALRMRSSQSIIFSS
jgi:hypothetical protein